MSYKGLSAYLKLSQNTLRHKVMNGKIPCIKVDGTVRFSKKKIDAWLEENQKGAKRKQVKNNGELFADGGSVEV
jgi:excisionase family DNA binding protein